MKLFVILSALMTAGFAHATCSGEAQIITKVKSVQQGNSACYMQIAVDATTLWNENMMCPLNVMDVVGQDVITGFICDLKAGDTVSGVIAYDSEGQLVLTK